MNGEGVGKHIERERVERDCNTWSKGKMRG